MSTEQLSTEPEPNDGRFVYRGDDDRPLSEAVVAAVAADDGTDDVTAVAREYGPLYDAIDPGALDSLFDSSGTPDRSGSVSFSYANRRVEVDSTGRVVLRSRA
ncbi:hypothetical protein SAMN05444422_11286 [Halobiforma haloterrestris]|uniref:Halobacterial output domain-containing protein n=1 Tax=Natronobacterium haloterrestre TaxID=148448 RepID=A0A1I1KQ33_NATHA|nr:HalOD1 output domain-containing protein [Halobiforma haloterrestris]SFC62821.1 hypothetical protein SAMN05444422_11286 [Halobiforma haloterrestris]